nr:MAG TPA: terminase small subunit [Caudoviricetes sp.]
MAKTMVRAEQKKRRISKSEKELFNEKEESFNNKLNSNVKAPNYLTSEEKRIFNKYKKDMQKLNILSVLDADILGHYSIFSKIFNDLRVELDKKGYMIGDKINPVIGEMRQVSKTMAGYQVKLGLNPTDRLRFIKNEVVERDELEDFIDEI